MELFTPAQNDQTEHADAIDASGPRENAQSQYPHNAKQPHKPKTTASFGVSSFAFRYSIGVPGSTPQKPMTGEKCIAAAADMGFASVQLCENLCFADMDNGVLADWAGRARDRGLKIEIGMQGLEPENLRRHLEICGIFQAELLRVVVGKSAADRPLAQLAGTLRDALPALKDRGVRIGIENHFDLPTADIRDLIDLAGDDAVGAVYDTTNAIGFVEHPLKTLDILGPRILSVHLKDYRMDKAEASYVMTGTVLGKGWLPVGDVVDRVLAYNPRAGFVVELTIRRGAGRSPEEAALDEAAFLAESVSRLRSILSNAIPLDHHI